MGIFFLGFVWRQIGAELIKLYLTSFVVKKALVPDNVFDLALIFSCFAIQRQDLHRLPFRGIAGIMILRAICFELAAILRRSHYRKQALAITFLILAVGVLCSI